MDSEWQVVPKKGARNAPKSVTNQATASITLKKENKKKNKKLKLETQWKYKMTVKKVAQRSNLKSSPELGKLFPSLPSKLKPSLKCYADALKKNLKSQEFFNQSQEDKNNHNLKNTDDRLLNSTDDPSVSAWSNFKWQYDSETTRQDTVAMACAGGEEDVNLNWRDASKNCEQQDQGQFYDLWKSSANSEYPINLMTTLFPSCAKKNETSNQTARSETSGMIVSDTKNTEKEHRNTQSKALRDILVALGLKKDSLKDDEDEAKTRTTDATKVTAKSEFGSIVNKDCGSVASNKFLYSECLKLTPGKESKNKQIVELKTTANPKDIPGKFQATEIGRGMGVTKVSNVAKTEQTLGNECYKRIQNDKMMNSRKTGEREKLYSIKNSEVRSPQNSSELHNNSRVSKTNDIPNSLKDDSFEKVINSSCVRSLKRKNPETCFRDLSFSFCKEEIKEVQGVTTARLYCNFSNSRSLSRNEIIISSTSNLTKSEKIALDRSKEICNEIESVSNSNYITNERLSSKVSGPNQKTIDSDVSDKIVHLKIEGAFSNIDLNFQKSKQNQKHSGAYYYFTEKSLVLSEISIASLERFLFTYKRMILYQVMDQPHVSLSYMNTRSRLPKSNLMLRPKEGSITDYKDLIRYDYCHQQTDNKEYGRFSAAISEEYKLLSRFKSKISKITSFISMCPMKSEQKKIKSIRKRRMSDSKVSKIRLSHEESSIPKAASTNDTSFILANDTYGYKPKFVNCEPGSRWYAKLLRIEECVPLSAFLLGFGEMRRSNTLHEIISPTGKTVFSSKEEHILRQGNFGTHIGLMSDGNPVVVRVFEKMDCETIQLLSRKRRLNHKNIVSFYCFCSSPDNERFFTVTELVEYSLSEYIKTDRVHSDKKHLVHDLVDGIQYLHGIRIVHGFLKPSNVMVTMDDRLKITGFYQLGITPVVHGIASKQSKCPAPIGSSAVSDLSWRPYELVAETTEKDARTILTKSSDIQMAGMLIYYILSEGKHPFGSTDLRCQENIRNGFPEFGPRPSDIESRDLIRDMIKRVSSQRPTVQEVAIHPYFWNIARRFEFLVHVARKIEFFTGRPTKIAEALQDSCIEARDWTSYIPPQILTSLSKWDDRTYTNNYTDLLHFLLIINDDFEILSQEMKISIGHPSYFISRIFPTFFMSLYCVVRDNHFVQQQMALQAYF